MKRYVVRLSAEERERLEGLIRKGKSPARRLLKARILLKADVSPAGEEWSDSQIIDALDTSISMVYRVRKQWVEEGLEAVLSRKQRATPAVPPIFDGEKAAGSIWPSPNSAFYPPNASIAASPTNKPSSRKLPLGSTTEMQITPRPIGTSQPPTHAPNSSTCTRQSDRIERLGV